MPANLIKILQDVRASYWFIPSIMTVFAFFLSFVMQWLDASYDVASLQELNWLTTTNAEGARSVLTVIAGSVMGVAGVTFSITIVAVSYASANYGPRLIGNFMRDRGNQVTLGIFIATFVYCLMILRTVQSGAVERTELSPDFFVPQLSILMALGLALASIGVLIYFIHHVPETINVGNIAAKIGADLRSNILKEFPDQEKLQPDGVAGASWDDKTDNWTEISICADDAGYIQTLNLERLGKLAQEHRLLISVSAYPGDFVFARNCVMIVYREEQIDDKLQQALRGCYAIGQHRTAHQNVLFLVDELVEIISRALSPGVNDPFTAITCLNWLKASIVCFALDKGEDDALSKSVPIRLESVTFEQFISAIFDQSRQYVCTDRNVSKHVFESLAEVARFIEKVPHRAVILKQMNLLDSACQQALEGVGAYEEVKSFYEDAKRNFTHQAS